MMNKAAGDKSSGPLLSVEHLSVEAGRGSAKQLIVSDVSFELKRGQVLGIIGESGAGKSTLGLAALGYFRQGCRAKSGAVRFDGIDLLELSEHERRALQGSRLTYVAQSAAASFNPAHRLIDQTIETIRRTRADARARAIDLYRQMRLPDYSRIGDRFPHQVSGGQLQRAMTAMAMAPMPDLIVFDEPTTALDVTTQVEVLSAMRDAVRTHNTAALYITHDLAVVAQMADRILVLRHGKFVEESPTRQMVAAPTAEYTKSLWAVRSIEKEPRKGFDVALSVRNLSARYPRADAEVLIDIDIDFRRACTTAVVGESGSGKSSLGRAICGLLQPHTGTVELGAGAQLPAMLAARSRDILKRVQLVHQSADTALNPRHTVRETLARPISYFTGLTGKPCERRIAELLNLIELPATIVDRLPHELSGGQKQRVNLARALAAQPDVIICDEVTSALDQVVQHGILKLLMDIQEQTGVTYMFVTHDIATVNAIADHVVVMHQGRVVEQGDRDAVLLNPKHQYTELLLSSVPEIDPDWLSHFVEIRREAAANVPAGGREGIRT